MDRKNLPQTRIVADAIILFILTAVGITTMIAMDEFGVKWAWPIVAMLGGILLFLIGHQTPIARRFLRLLVLLFPIIKILVDDAARGLHFNTTIKNVEYILGFYRLCKRLNLKFFDIFSRSDCLLNNAYKEDLIRRMANLEEGEDISRFIIEDITPEKMTHPIDSKVLRLLYNAFFDKTKNLTLFSTIKGDKAALADLVDVLKHRNYLPDHGSIEQGNRRPKDKQLLAEGTLPSLDALFPYTDDDVKLILQEMGEFKPQQVTREMRQLQRVWEIVMGYLAFLIENRIAVPESTLSVGEMLEWIKDLPAKPSRHNELLGRIAERKEILPDLLSKLWQDIVGDIRPLTKEQHKKYHAFLDELGAVFGQLPEQELKQHSLISQTLFYTEKRRDCKELKEDACSSIAKNNTATKMTLAYLEFREDLRDQTALDGLNYVSSKYLAKHWRETIQKREKQLGAGLTKELNIVKANLKQGTWLTRLPPVIKGVYKKVDKDLKRDKGRLVEKIKEKPGVGGTLKRVFLNLKLETIERFLETRSITAYLLTFNCQEGSLADLFECLRKEDRRTALEAQGIDFSIGGKPKYVFRNYTANSRIGITPMGIQLDEFYHILEQDLQKAYTYQQTNAQKEIFTPIRPLKKYEFIIHRFGLSERDRYGFDDFLPEEQVKNALSQIRALLEEALEFKDKVDVIGYQQQEFKGKVTIGTILKDMIIEGTIVDATQHQIIFRPNQVKELVNQDQQIKKQLLKLMKRRDMLTLSKAMLKNLDERETAITRLSTLLFTLSSLNQDTHIPLCEEISEVYIDTLVDIIGLA